MELELDNGKASNRIQSYHDHQIVVNNLTYSQSILLMPELFICPWGPKGLPDLKAEHFEIILPYHPQVFILGTGDTLQFPASKIYQQLIDQQIGIEVMNTAAACRTYMVLMAEGRRVACGLLC